jgi:hypothetical protein
LSCCSCIIEPRIHLQGLCCGYFTASPIVSVSPDRDEDDGNLRDQPVDPNEPDDDGEDLSDVQLSSGSTFDPETGWVPTGELDAEEDSDGDDSGPESELEDSEEDDGDEEY